MDTFDEENEFEDGKVKQILMKAITKAFADTEFDENKHDARTNTVVDECIKGLQQLHKPFKYATTVIASQRVGAGCQTAAGFYWDTQSDRFWTVKYADDYHEVTVTAYAMAIDPSKGAGSG